jgi:hypothetical protein
MASQTSSFGSNFFFCEYQALRGTHQIYLYYNTSAFSGTFIVPKQNYHPSITTFTLEDGFITVLEPLASCIFLHPSLLGTFCT